MPFVVAALTLFTGLMATDAEAETAGDRQAGATLTAGEIDSSTVEVGAFAVVIHGLGERHPVSGAWKQLRTDRGYIVAIDAETLTLGLGRDEWSVVIALKRIQTLVLAGAPGRDGGVSGRTVLRFKERPDTRSGRMDDMGAGGRMIVKLLSGALSGAGIGLIGGVLSLPLSDECSESEKVGPFCTFFVLTGYVAGMPVGVSMVDPHDSLVASLAGTLAGSTVAHMLRSDILLHVLAPTFAILSSEWSRERPEAHRFSVGLVPDTKGHLSAVATLRF